MGVKFILEIEEGNTPCEQCKYRKPEGCRFGLDEIDCDLFDLRTMKITRRDR